jgi:hypothetical protein
MSSSSSNHLPSSEPATAHAEEPPAIHLEFATEAGDTLAEMVLPSHLACHLALTELSAPTIPVPSDMGIALLAFHARASDDGGHELVRYSARLIAGRLFLQDDEEAHEAGSILFKELGKAGDMLAILQHAELLTQVGPHRNHQHANTLVVQLLAMKAPFDSNEGYARLHHLRGMLLWKGQNLPNNADEAFAEFKKAADDYEHGESAWLVSNFYSRKRHPQLFSKLKLKPSAALASRYLALSQKLGYEPRTFYDHLEF